MIYPHHEFSAAHGQSITGTDRFARFYIHTGMLGYEGEKMSKSLGNLVFVSQLRKQGIAPSIIRLALFDEAYAKDRMWDDQLLAKAKMRWQLWHDAISRDHGPDSRKLLSTVAQYLSDNLDTTRAFHAIDSWANDALTGLGADQNAGRYIRQGIEALLGITVQNNTPKYYSYLATGTLVRVKTFDALYAELAEKVKAHDINSSTVQAISSGVHSLGKKIIEEAGEVWLAAEYQDDRQLAEEISQLLYWVQTIMIARNISLEDVYTYL